LPDWTGISTVNVTAKDPSGEEVTTTFSVMVGAVNDAPTIVGSGGPALVHEASEATFWVEVEDRDSTEISYRWLVDGVPVPGEYGDSFSFAPGDLLIRQVMITAEAEDDWGAKASLDWNVGILDSPRIVSTSPVSPFEGAVGTFIEFIVEVEDADTPQPSVTWTWNGDLVGNKAQLLFPLSIDEVGANHMLVFVGDGIGNDSYEWTVDVYKPNLAPRANITSPLNGWTVERGETVSLSVDILDDQEPNTIEVRWFVDGSPVGTGWETAYTAVRVGELTIQVNVFDGEHYATDSVSLKVRLPSDDDGGGIVGGGSASGWLFLIVLGLGIAGLIAVVVVRRRHGPQD
jgi:hypothetical protein